MKSLRTTIAVLGVATALSAFAQAQGSEELGTPLAVSDGRRTIEIRPESKHVNVDHGEAIKFVVGQTQFAWRFDGTSRKVFDLGQIAPSGALANPIKVYVRPPPLSR